MSLRGEIAIYPEVAIFRSKLSKLLPKIVALVQNSGMTVRNLSVWLGSVLLGSVPVAGLINKVSGDVFERKLKKFEILNPHYEKLKSSMYQNQNFFIMAKGNLVRTIGSTMVPDIYDTSESLPDYLRRTPYQETMLNFPISAHLPRKCQKLVKNLLKDFENGVRLINQIADYYRGNSFFQDTYLQQKNELNEAQKMVDDAVKSIEEYIEKDKLHLTKSVRRRLWPF